MAHWEIAKENKMASLEADVFSCAYLVAYRLHFILSSKNFMFQTFQYNAWVENGKTNTKLIKLSFIWTRTHRKKKVITKYGYDFYKLNDEDLSTKTEPSALEQNGFL